MKTTQTKLGLFALAAAVTVAACYKVDPPLPPPKAATVRSFTASAPEVAAGQKVTLSWEVEDATSVAITQQGKGALAGVDNALSGQVQVTLDEDAVFLINAGGAGGADSAAVAVAIKREQPGVIFSAVPTEITAGESTTLVWNAPRSTTVTLTAGGQPVDIGNKPFGSLTLRPLGTTTYELDADGRKVTVTVTVGAAIFEFKSSSAAADAGSPVTLSWRTGGGEKLVVSSPGRGELLTETNAAKMAVGSFTDNVPDLPDNALVNYDLALTQGSTVLHANVVVHVGVAPAITRFDVPALAQAGGMFTVAWQTVNADSVRVAVDGMVLFEAPTAAAVADGQAVLPTPAAKAKITLIATNSRGGSATLAKDVEPIGAVTLVSFTADKTTIVNAGEAVKLSWEVTNGRHLKLDVKGAYTLKEVTGATVGTGSMTVYPNVTTEYVLVADNLAGSTLQPASVTVTVTNSAKVVLTPDPAPSGAVVSVTGHTVSGGGNLLNLPNAKKNVAGDAFVDISTTGTDIGFAPANLDTGAQVYTLPDRFTGVVYGGLVSGYKLSISANGWFVVSDVAKTGTDDSTLPGTALEPLSVAPYYEDLRAVAGSKVFVKLEGSDLTQRVIVQWQDFERDTVPGSKLTFQAQLYARGKVVFAYKTLQGLTTATTSPALGVTDVTEANTQLATDQTPAEGVTYTLFDVTPLPVAIKASTTPYIYLVGVGTDGYVAIPAASQILAANQFSITEANVAPAPGVMDGEWFEVTSKSTAAIDLKGWVLDFGGTGNTHVVASSVVLPAGGRVLFGQSATGGDGLAVDYVYPNTLKLPDATGTVKMLVGTTSYTSSTWPTAAVPGAATTFEPLRTDVVYASGISGAFACPGTTPYGTNGQLGTPKAANSQCIPYTVAKLAAGNFEALAGVAGAVPIALTNTNEAITAVPLVTPVKLFGATVSALSVGSNGWLAARTITCASATNCYGTNRTTPVPGSEPFGLVAPFWDDLAAITGSGGTQGSLLMLQKDPDGTPANGDEYTIVSWENWRLMTASTTETSSLNFQVKLFANGNVEYHYAGMTASLNATISKGSSATSWLELPSGAAAVKVNINSSTAPGIDPNSGWKFSWAP